MMHLPYENGSSIILQQDEYTEEKDKRDVKVYIPPVEYVYQRHPKWESHGELVYSGVWSRSDKPEEQYWDRKAFLAQWDFDYFERRKKEKRHQLEDPDYLDHELEDFREAMWRYRVNGMWFMNNGKPVYITGLYWFYLVWWKLDTGYPKFRIPDWEGWLFWQYCVDAPTVMGMIESQRRRQGKTVRSGCMLYEYTSSHKEAHGGIQSKTGKDAQESVYWKGVVMRMKHLPDFFIPKYDREKGKFPKSGISFTETNIRGKGSLEELTEEFDELDSTLTWKPSDHVAYDGSKLHRYVGDEVGKVEPPINVFERHLVVRYCFLDDEFKIIGKALYTTTVEKMDAGGLEFRQLWDGSNQSNLNENGMTNTGLFRYFMPAYRTLYIDKYGYPDEERAKKELLAERKKLEEDGEFVALASMIRKTPFSVKEMFYIDPNDCLLNAIEINRRLEELTWMDIQELYHIGNLSWEGVPFESKVKFTKTPLGRWWIRKDYDPNNPELWNKYTKEGSSLKPDGDRMAGIDPFDHNKTKDKRRSNGACYVGTLPDATNIANSMVPIVEYIDRPPTAALFYEDMAMTLLWTGAEATIEDNRIGLINFLNDKGMSAFVKEFDGKQGISGSSAIKPHIFAELTEFVDGKDKDIKKCTFVRLLNDLLIFDIEDTEKNDAGMAFSYYRIGCFAYKYRKKPDDRVNLPNDLIDVNDVLPNYHV